MSQQMQALDKANRVRYGIRDVKEELRGGVLSLRDALSDERVLTMPVHKLLASQERWGPTRAMTILTESGISPLRPVGGLTEREAERIATLSLLSPKERRLFLYRENLDKVLKEAKMRNWKPRLLDDRVIVMTPLGEAVLTDLEDVSFLLAELGQP